jgi:hypothetical protein
MRLAIAALAIAASALPAAAQNVELPQRRAGQWEIRMNLPGRGEIEVQHCTDEATDRDMMQAGLNMSRDMCQRFEMRREGAGFVMESVCQFGQMRSSSRAVFSGDFQSGYSMQLTGTTEGGPQGRSETNLTQTARWVSAECRGGLAPGDMLMPGGMRVNVREMMRMAPGGGGGGQQQQQPPQPRR